MFLAACMGVAAAATGAVAHEASSAGTPGDPGLPARTVDVVMSDGVDGMRFSPDRIEAHRGEQIRFVIRNDGSLAHEFFLGGAGEIKRHAAMMDTMPDMKHDEPNAATLGPGATTMLLWRFPRRGEFEFACLIPGHFKAGMHGTIAVR